MRNILFGNPGEKLKNLALVIFWFILVSSVIEGICLIFVGINWYEVFHDIRAYEYEKPLIIAGLFTPFVGALVAWLSSIALYAFGQLVEDTSVIRENTQSNKTNTDS